MKAAKPKVLKKTVQTVQRPIKRGARHCVDVGSLPDIAYGTEAGVEVAEQEPEPEAETEVEVAEAEATEVAAPLVAPVCSAAGDAAATEREFEAAVSRRGPYRKTVAAESSGFAVRRRG